MGLNRAMRNGCMMTTVSFLIVGHNLHGISSSQGRHVFASCVQESLRILLLDLYLAQLLEPINMNSISTEGKSESAFGSSQHPTFVKVQMLEKDFIQKFSPIDIAKKKKLPLKGQPNEKRKRNPWSQEVRQFARILLL